MQYIKDFDNWYILKSKLNSKESKIPYFNEGEIWWTSIGVNIEYEEDDKGILSLRPVLVLRKYNNSLFLGIPFSSKLKCSESYLKISFKNKQQSILLAQMRVFSSKRLNYKYGVMEDILLSKTIDNILEYNFGKFLNLP